MVLTNQNHRKKIQKNTELTTSNPKTNKMTLSKKNANIIHTYIHKPKATGSSSPVETADRTVLVLVNKGTNVVHNTAQTAPIFYPPILQEIITPQLLFIEGKDTNIHTHLTL